MARQRTDDRRRRRRSWATWILRIGLPLLGAAAVLATLHAGGGDLHRYSASTAAVILGLEAGVPALLSGLTARGQSAFDALLWVAVTIAAEVALVFGAGFALLGLGPK